MLKVLKRKRYIIPAAFFLVFTLFIFTPAMASEDTQSAGNESVHSVSNEGGSDHEQDRSGDLRDLLYRFINFTLLVIILFIVLKKTGVKDLLSSRSDEIRQRMEDLKKEKEEAESRYQDIEKQLKEFEEKKKDIIDQFRNEGLAEKDRIISEAKERVEQIIEQSELTIQQEIQSAKDRLKRDVVDLAAQKAREIIAKEIDEDDQDKLVDEFIERVGKIH
jgi:F-type H+-transporting ATPase subunit b